MRKQVTLYDTLGVERDASEQDIRKAFRRLALKYHPDRFAGDQRPDAEERFQGITEAFNVLCHPESRETYDKEISHGTDIKSMDAKEISRRLAAKGSQLMREGKMAEAVESLKTAIDHDDDNARAHYFYGQVIGRISGKERDALRHVGGDEDPRPAPRSGCTQAGPDQLEGDTSHQRGRGWGQRQGGRPFGAPPGKELNHIDSEHG